MKILNHLSLGLIISALLVFLIEKISALGVSTWLATKACGESYLKEPDLTLAQQGLLTENACGFDADMYLMVFLIGMLLMGILLKSIRRD